MSSVIDSLTTSSSSTTSSTSTSSSSSSTSLDKDDFLLLLVTQMQYQDPLNPSSDTEFVSQLAQFSELEQMQNLNETITNSQVYGLIGADVEITTTSTSGAITVVQGTVDYAEVSSGTAQISVDGTLYDLEDVTAVYPANYFLQQGLPSIDEAISVAFDKDDPEDVTFTVNPGSGDTVATYCAIYIDGELVDSDYVTMDDDEVTISAEAFEDLDNGTYYPSIIFNDDYYTTVTDKITLTVTGGEDTEDTTDDTTDDSTTDDDTTTDSTDAE
jgi:flagellar basal-body rod modification protein FlgD